jgi:flavin-dependent dehydrogenase
LIGCLPALFYGKIVAKKNSRQFPEEGMPLKLQKDAKIAVVGGGPAGSFFAHFILTRGRRAGIRPEVIIYDRKSFLDLGPKGCNMCAGALGHHLVEHLRRERIPLPAHVIRQEIEGYVLHVREKSVLLRQDERPIYTVFRGNSPEVSHEGIISFDQFLLDNAVSTGAQFVRQKVTAIQWPEEPSERVRLSLHDGSSLDADLVVGAFGVNTSLRNQFMKDYVPPRTWVACQAEMPVDREFSRRTLGSNIHVFALADPQIQFVAFTPKGNFITLTAIGPSVKMADLQEALLRPEFRPYLPRNWTISCHCHPHFPVTAATKPYGDRGLLVGDACKARYLKNGIESAYFTALFAAKTSLDIGIGESDLVEYDRMCRRRFAFDNRCGKILFAIHNVVAGHQRLARAHILLAEVERTVKGRRRQVLANSLWSMFTGDIPYRKILADLLRPSVQIKLVFEGMHSLMSTARSWDRYAERKLARLRARSYDKRLRLKPNSTIAIVGGGPGGCACAIRLLNRARAAGLPIRVVIYEGKDFDRHYNQCVGVLSPPLETLLLEELKVELPEELINQRIETYRLHSDNSDVLLSGPADSKPTYTVRRVMFDRFLLHKAEEAGAEVVRSRVTGVEFINRGRFDEVRIYSESQSLRADAVIGAFGLDEAMLDIWERATRDEHPYERPRELFKTFITKIDTEPAYIEKALGNTIHAFLPAHTGIEFGAVTPKGDHIIVNIAGRNVSSLDLDAFLELAKVRELLPDINTRALNFYAGHFPTAPATHPCGHRYVLVGDATGWMRPFKGKGVNIAVITGVRAADTIFERGFSRKAFEEFEQNCAELRKDYSYGLIVRWLCRVGRLFGLFDVALRAAQHDERLQSILYMAVSGEDSYRKIVLRLLRPLTAGRLILNSGKHLLNRLRPARVNAHESAQ